MLYLKIFLTLPYFLNVFRKADSYRRKVFKNPDHISEEKRYYWVRKMSRYLLWLCNVKIVTHNLKNWVDRGCLLVGNHQSSFDGVLLMALNDFAKTAPIAFIAKKEVLNTKAFKNFVQLIDVLFLDRENLRSAVKIIKEADELIRVPRGMVLFPEGTRSKTEEMSSFKPSFLKIAQKAYVPIVPFAIINTCKIEIHSFKKNYIHIVFIKTLKPQTFLHNDTLFLAKKIQSTIKNEIDKYKNIKASESKSMYKLNKKLKKEAKKAKDV